MEVITTLKDLKTVLGNSAVVTIGMFDGVHLGHQKVLKTAKELANKNNVKLLVITFINHPKEILSPSEKITFLSTLDERLALLEMQGVDLVLTLEFTSEFSQQTAYEFLNAIYTQLPFSHLVLGYNATLGSDQKNNREHVLKAAKTLGFEVLYVEKDLFDGKPVSSGRIRKALAEGDVTKAEQLLGHKL